MHIDIPTKSSIGAVVSDVDLTSLTSAQFDRIYQLFLDRSVVVFDRVHLDQSEHIAFSKRFGRLERTLSKRTKRPEISLLSNVTVDGQVAKQNDSLGLFLKGNRSWHSDSSFKVVSAKASLLRAIEVPDTGGDTEWADMIGAWDALSAEKQQSLSDLVGVHSYQFSQGLVGGTDLLKSREWDDLPPVEHPLVKMHSEKNEYALFLGRHIAFIKGMSEEDSQALIGDLTQEACQPPRLFRHSWHAGDVVIWDNRSVLHRGHPWPFDQRRVMRRTTIAGEGANPWVLSDENHSVAFS